MASMKAYAEENPQEKKLWLISEVLKSLALGQASGGQALSAYRQVSQG